MSQNLNNKDNPGNQPSYMYSYQQNDDKNTEIAENGAIRRSLNDINPNAVQSKNNLYQNEGIINRNSLVIQVGNNPPLDWMFFVIFGILHLVFIVFLANYYDWDKNNKPSTIDEKENKTTKSIIQNKYKTFQDINVMIFLGFGFLRAFLKHYSWSSIALTLVSGVLSFELGLFSLICWSAIIGKDWKNGLFNFEHIFDANYCAATIIISMGAILGKLSFPQYFITVIIETIFATLNYVLLRYSIKIIDVGGALTVHLFAAIFGGFFSFISFFRKQERERIQLSPHLGMNYNSNIFGLFGTLILISYWPSFNTSLIEGNQKYRGIINTYLSIGGSIVSTFLISSIFNHKKLKEEDILNATFSGGIIVAGCCHIINHFWSSILLGNISGAISCCLFFALSEKLKQKGFHDTANIIYYHGIPGFLGGITSSIFVGNLAKWDGKVNINLFIGTILKEEFIDNNSNDYNYSKKAGILFICIFLTILIAGASGLCAGYIIKFCNCHMAVRYFNDSEFFDVEKSETEPFPWIDEEVLNQEK